MTQPLSTIVIAGALLLAGYALVTTLRDRPMSRGHLAALAVVEALLIAQAVVGAVALAGGRGPGEGVTFIGYLIGVLLIPVAGAGWGILERSRWGPAVIVVAGLAVAVMTVRMQQIWTGTGA